MKITIPDNETFGFDYEASGSGNDMDSGSGNDEASGFASYSLSGLTIGDSVTLNCTVTTVIGISSLVNIMWYTEGSVVRRVDNLTVAYTVNNSAIYTDLFEISSLTAIHNGRYYYCSVVINPNQPIYGSDHIMLNFSGEYT